MHIKQLLPAAVLCLATVAAHADTFTFNADGGAGGFSGSGTLDATANGGGSYRIDSISGTFVTGLVAVGGFNGNDNLLFPSSTSLVDSNGFAFKALQGNTGFTVRIFDTSGKYYAQFLDSDGIAATLPVDFTLNPTSVTPEPSSLLLLATGSVKDDTARNSECRTR